MSVDGSHLGWQAGSSDTILKGDHLRTIPVKVWSQIGLAVSEEKICKTFFPQGPMLKLCRLMDGFLGWQVAGVTDDPFWAR